MKTTTQYQVLIKLMIEDWTSPLDGFKQAGTFKLCTRVGELKEHFTIKDRWVTKKNKFGNTVNFKEYKIVRPSKKALAVYGL